MDRTPEGTPTVDLGPPNKPARSSEPTETSAFDPPEDRFDTIGEIGRGGMGRVDDAYDRALDRPVAIKHMLSTEAVDLARFEREAKITARLEHPGIVPIHDAGRTADGTPYYVMRRVDGQPLDQLVTRKLAERLALIPNILAACDAVAFAHSRGIVHRDIKPTNILVGPFGETLVIDWGLARNIVEGTRESTAIVPSTDQGLTRVGTVAGTPGFMSPEQARGEAVDARADVFALGSTLFYVLAGALPYGVESATEMIGLAGEGRSADWNKVPEAVPPDLVAIARKAMAPEAVDRYPDASALAADLRQFITGNLVGAYEYSASAKLLRFVRRHRAAVAVAAIAFAVVGAGGALSVRRVLAERDSAQHERELADQGRRQASASADRLRIDHALELSHTDPVAAIAVLRMLPNDSPHWAEARIAAQSAFLNGIPFGYTGTHDTQLIAIQRDNRHMFAAEWNGGLLQVLDLVDHTKLSLQIEREVRGFGWLGPDHIAVARPKRLDILDIHSNHVRSLELECAGVRSDHGDKLWVLTSDRRLIEIVGPDGEPRELARGVRELMAAPDLSRAILTHEHNTVTIWTPEGEIPLTTVQETPDYLPTFDIGGNLISEIDGGVLHMWHLDGKRVIDDGVMPGKRYFILAMVANDAYITISKEGLGRISHGEYEIVDKSIGICFPTLSGAIQITEEGSLRLFDERGRFLVGKRAAGLRRADVSSDSRFVVGLAETGNILAWDLKGRRPQALHVIASQQFARLSEHYLWLGHSADGISRLDLATGKLELLLPEVLTGDVYVDPKERWIAATSGDEVVIYDLTTHRQLATKPFGFNSHGDGLVLLQPDGSIETWDVGEDHPRTRGHIRGKDPNAVAAGGRFAFVRFDDHVERIDLDTNTLTRSDLATTGFGAQDNGRVWLETSTAEYTWDPGSLPVKFDLPNKPSNSVVENNSAVFYTPDSVTLVSNGKVTTVALPSKVFSWSGSQSFATLSAQGVPSIVDLATGVTFEIPTRAERIATYGDMLAAAYADELEIWRFDIPHDAALQAWLDTITNAISVPGSDAYTWP